MRFGHALSSGWCHDIFTANAVRNLSAAACPNFELTADATSIAFGMNEAAAELQLKLAAEVSPSEAKDWADELARSAEALGKACGPRPIDTALRIGINHEELLTMLQILVQVRSAASSYAGAAAAETKSGRPRRPAVDAWLRRMIEIFEVSFGRSAGIATGRSTGKRGGPASRFIAGAAAWLLSNHQADAQSARLTAALGPMKNAATVARSMINLATKARMAEN